MTQESWQDKLRGMFPDSAPDAAETPAPESASDSPVQSGRLDIILDRKGRNGKVATIVAGFTIGDEATAQIASRLKRALGTGGSSRGGEILIQGDRRRDVLDFLIAEGLKARII